MKSRIMAAVSVLSLLCLSLALVSPVLAAGAVNDFTIPDYQIDYTLGRDRQNRSTLKTTETITALFPATDQNHGIERALPTQYDGHPTSLQVTSVTDAVGKPRTYTTYGSNHNLVVRIGNTDGYVHGQQTYKISYSQRDVTKYFADTNDDEFYWDTNGTQWAVPISNLSVRLHLADGLHQALNGKQQCYVGQAGASNPCTIVQTAGVFQAGATNLAPGENVTVAFGFTPHTFAVYATPLGTRLLQIWGTLLVLTLPIALLLVIWFLVRRYRKAYRIAEITTIVPEYLPPRDTSVSAAATISRKPTTIFSAQLIDLAVRHYLKLYQMREKSLFRKAQFELELTKDISELKAEEQELLRDIFSSTSVGTRLDMSSLRRNTSIGLRLSDNQKKLNKNITGQYGLKARDDAQTRWYTRAAGITCIGAILTLSPWLLIAALVSLIIGLTLKPLTDSGLELARYLNGLEVYIRMAETDRIRVLQSPEGAAKVAAPIDTNDTRQLVTLYERVLPYAILFGLEKDWNKQLGQYYEKLNESPTWYAGNNGYFNAAVFATALSSFNQVANYTNTTSSTSGGSGGGGFSGGGGGGGGGGGW